MGMAVPRFLPGEPWFSVAEPRFSVAELRSLLAYFGRPTFGPQI